MGLARNERTTDKRGGKHTKKGKQRTRSSKDRDLEALATTKRHDGSARKLDLKKRAARVREWQGHMEAARVHCTDMGIGAVKYLNPENNTPQLDGCPLRWKDKSRLAANIKSGNTPRRGEHMQHLTDAEEHDVACEMVKSAHERNPRTWRSMEEAVAEAIANRQNGPKGRAFTRPTAQGVKAAKKADRRARWGENGLW